MDANHTDHNFVSYNSHPSLAHGTTGAHTTVIVLSLPFLTPLCSIPYRWLLKSLPQCLHYTWSFSSLSWCDCLLRNSMGKPKAHVSLLLYLRRHFRLLGCYLCVLILITRASSSVAENHISPKNRCDLTSNLLCCR